ncbi:50S ribosomal protein L35 [Patescibacteria group bacterium]|nr:50S ribosomal protein L35 [Patescibacteria group bacterium]
MKTNKSYTKRLRVTKKGKILARKPGQNHFNAKEPRRARLNRKRTTEFSMSNKNKARFLLS